MFSWQSISIDSGNGLVPNSRQAIVWTNEGVSDWRMYASLGLDEYTWTFCWMLWHWNRYSIYFKRDKLSLIYSASQVYILTYAYRYICMYVCMYRYFPQKLNYTCIWLVCTKLDEKNTHSPVWLNCDLYRCFRDETNYITPVTLRLDSLKYEWPHII